ncbi:Hypothetical_protein [Hexamita inflata]|uniref:Hypothetical_protein n=1 Tax=Hexamita inflata TaxID=28002 RepID=A0AA86PCL9_9EUKA|nr:Hypothetical protein HINF_LOCUS22976 [Hexamita inflata]
MKYESQTARFALTYRLLELFWEISRGPVSELGWGSAFEVMQYSHDFCKISKKLELIQYMQFLSNQLKILIPLQPNVLHGVIVKLKFKLKIQKRCQITHRTKYIKAVTQMRKQNHLDWKKDENHFNQLENHQPQELLKYILFLLGYGKITIKQHFNQLEIHQPQLHGGSFMSNPLVSELTPLKAKMRPPSE